MRSYAHFSDLVPDLLSAYGMLRAVQRAINLAPFRVEDLCCALTLVRWASEYHHNLLFFFHSVALTLIVTVICIYFYLG
jgi:hypothetical protein